MSMKRMKHPLHGFHHPLSGGELATMLANGWTEDVEPEIAASVEVVSVEASVEVALVPAPKRQYNRKGK